MQEAEERLAMVCGMMLILADTDNLSFPGWAAVTLTFSFHSTNIASWVSWRDRENLEARSECGARHSGGPGSHVCNAVVNHRRPWRSSQRWYM